MIAMKLQDKYFEYINNGTKRIELRLLDEKRKKIKIGDEIIFNNSYGTKILKAKVKNLLYYKTFEELVNDYEIDYLASKEMTKKELLDELEKYYPKEKQLMHSVVGIELVLC